MLGRTVWQFRSNPVMLSTALVMLSAAKHLVASRARPFAECTLSATNVLRVTTVSNEKVKKHECVPTVLVVRLV